MLSRKSRKGKNRKGFTLIELIIVIAILGILALIAIPRLGGFSNSAKKAADDATAEVIERSLEMAIASDEIIPGSAGEIKVNKDGVTSISPLGFLKNRAGTPLNETDIKKKIEELAGLEDEKWFQEKDVVKTITIDEFGNVKYDGSNTTPPPDPTTQATPSFSPAAGPVASGTTVTITSSGADNIYYTTDGSTPATSVTGVTSRYSSSITINSAMTIKAIAVKSGLNASAVATAAYTISAAVTPQATPTFSPPAGPVASGATVTITSSGAEHIYYTTDGTTPATSVTGTTHEYSTAITINSPMTIKAIATKSDKPNSAVATASYTLSSPVTPQATPTFSPAAGAVASGTTVSIASPGADHIYYTTDGSTPATSVTGATSQYSSPIAINSPMTIKAIATKSDKPNSAVATADYTIAVTPTLTAPTISPASGAVASGTNVTITSPASEGATIRYTMNGTNPTASSPVYSNPITVNAAMTVKAIAIKNGWNNSPIATATYTIATPPAPTLRFSTTNGYRDIDEKPAILAPDGSYSFTEDSNYLQIVDYYVRVSRHNNKEMTPTLTVSKGGTSWNYTITIPSPIWHDGYYWYGWHDGYWEYPAPTITYVP